MQGAADRRLAQEQPRCGTGDIAFFRKSGKDDEQVEVGLAKMRYAHSSYRYYALD